MHGAMILGLKDLSPDTNQEDTYFGIIVTVYV